MDNLIYLIIKPGIVLPRVSWLDKKERWMHEFNGFGKTEKESRRSCIKNFLSYKNPDSCIFFIQYENRPIASCRINHDYKSILLGTYRKTQAVYEWLNFRSIIAGKDYYFSKTFI